MATPYFQIRLDTVSSTQDVARGEVEDLPVLVLATGQSRARGRSGSEWQTADRALAASLAVSLADTDDRPLSLMAGVAAIRATSGTLLKWPNDVLVDGLKVGGILVERSGDVTVVGLGLNLWWSSLPGGAGALFANDPGGETHAEIGALWGAELMELVESDGWPLDVYREVCDTLGRNITWDPSGAGKAIDIAPDGALMVETPHGREALHSGAVHHLRES